MIEVCHFWKYYDDQPAVRDLSFQVAAGQVLGLIGPNGAGKTTTLRAMAGMIPASDGHLRVGGSDVGESPEEVKRKTYYVPDDPQLFNDLSVAQHFAFTASVYRVGNWQSEMERWLDRFELLPQRDKRAGDLSRGMRQKLAIGCAYLARPSALLLDEPMTGLDPRGIRELKESIREQSELGSALIISSHLLAMVEDICSHVLILDHGEARFHGPLQELRERFADRRKGSLEDIFFEALGAGNTRQSEVSVAANSVSGA